MENLLLKIREIIRNIKNDLSQDQISEYVINTEVSHLFDELPKHYFGNEQASLVLTEDTYIELGNQQVPSCRLLIPVYDSKQINNGKITVIGPDLSLKIPEKSVLPFAQLIFIYSQNPKAINPDLYRKLQIHTSVFNIINGFMIRAVPRKFWIRISKELINLGFNLELLGKFLIFHILKKFFEISKIEIVFITTAADKIKNLEILSSNIQELYSDTEIRRKLKEIEAAEKSEEMTSGKKRLECDYEWSCNDCDYNKICDEIIDIIKKMKQFKEKTK